MNQATTRSLSIFSLCLILLLTGTACTGFSEPLNNPSAITLPAPSESKKNETLEIALKADGDRAFQRLKSEIHRIAVLTGGTVGLSALHIESGRCFSLNGMERFPMASAYKIPIAVQLLSRVDCGDVDLDQFVTIRGSDIHPGSGKLILTFKKKAASYTVRELLELMLLVSDNTASDALLNLAGGPEAVTAFMKTLGIRDLDVSRSTLNMLADWRGIDELPPPEDFSVEKYNRLRSKVPMHVLEKAQNRFYSDIRDTATPDAMTRLVAMVHCGTVLKPESTTLLLKIMERCKTGQSRIRGLIPPGMATANKTGTIGPGIVNDVALLTLPGDAGHLALTIFIKSSDRSLSYQEQTMAQIARYLYDYYFFNGTASAVAASGESCSLQNRICCRKDVR